MSAKSLFYIANRAFDLGISGIAATLQRRLSTKIWQLCMRRKARAGSANHSWATIVLNNKLSFENFFTQHTQQSIIKAILDDTLFQTLLPTSCTDLNKITQQANDARDHIFNILGSGSVTLGDTLDWHYEFKKNNLKKPFTRLDSTFSYSSYKNVFHTDIPIPQQKTDASTYHEDVKVLWDLGRMHHLTKLGLAYTKTGNKTYADVFVHDIESYWLQVPYLLGPHWKCPMDVAIRAINLLWSLELFKQAAIDLDFWQRYVCMLYDHLIYLEWNFEESDKPNNHLLTDYVGYLYLVAFFKDLPGFDSRLTWAIKTTAEAFFHQILADGSAYEGSTAYHRLDCELLVHVTSLLRAIGKEHNELDTLLQKMLGFLKATTDQGNNLVTIGDDDSGCIVFGLKNKFHQEQLSLLVLKNFPDFGLAIARTNRLHITLRSAPLATKRPTGHVHHDALSFTLSIDGQPIFIDPGSFVYTANKWWRTFFKSSQQHNTFFLENTLEEVTDLFQTKSLYTASSLLTQKNKLFATTKFLGSTLQRSIEITDSTITLHDAITINNAATTTWRFILHPEITVSKHNDHYILSCNGNDLATLTSSLQLQLEQTAAFASSYGNFFPTQTLTCTMVIPSISTQKTIIFVL
ncbi:hypothetical protein FJ364_01655 [Candidatus Dependentiae bacterium]|nr:hypothetical protein [Candidatus Dependentiae bacterium]